MTDIEKNIWAEILRRGKIIAKHERKIEELLDEVHEIQRNNGIWRSDWIQGTSLVCDGDTLPELAEMTGSDLIWEKDMLDMSWQTLLCDSCDVRGSFLRRKEE